MRLQMRRVFSYFTSLDAGSTSHSFLAWGRIKNINDPSGASKSEPLKATEGFLFLWDIYHYF